MSAGTGIEILRASIFHTPGNPFLDSRALQHFADGGLAIDGGRILACDDYRTLAAAWPDATVRDLRGSFLTPGFIDTHIHFPQARIIGALGYSLLDWLEQITLPEEARLADAAYAVTIAEEFVRALAAHGTTSALVFGSHFAPATGALFEAARRQGLRITSGLVMADRNLRPELHQTPEDAYRESRTLIERFEGCGRLTYAVTPRFALSASEAMLEVCTALLESAEGLRFTTHINESLAEVEHVRQLFPWAPDYLSVYERYKLIGRRSVLAHNIHASDDEMERISVCGATVSHCPGSNTALGSGIFPLARHVERGVRCALGTDIGGGTGFGMIKEALMAHLMQRVAARPFTLSAAMMLYLATRAGAEALALDEETGDFAAGKAADFVVIRPAPDSDLSHRLIRTETPEQILAALFTLATDAAIAEVRVANDVAFSRSTPFSRSA